MQVIHFYILLNIVSYVNFFFYFDHFKCYFMKPAVCLFNTVRGLNANKPALVWANSICEKVFVMLPIAVMGQEY